MSDENEMVKDDDFEGHQQVGNEPEATDDAGESDFEGHLLAADKHITEKTIEG